MTKYIVTGAAGFIGSRIVERLLADKISPSDILAVDLSEELYLTRLCSVKAALCKVPFLDFKSFASKFAEKTLQPKVIFHMGACSSTDETRQDYLDEHNLNYSKKLWELCVQENVKFIYASSGATYGAGENGFTDEPDRIPLLKPLNLYGWSKQNFDVFVLEQIQKKSQPSVWAGLKFFNVYGPGESHKNNQASVVFHARNQISKTGKLKLFQSHKEGIADGEQKRDFVYVEDCVDVAIACMQGFVNSGIYNVGSGQARTFLDLARATFDALKVPRQIEFIPTPENLRSHYQYYTCASLNRLRVAGFKKPTTTLEDGVALYMKNWEND